MVVDPHPVTGAQTRDDEEDYEEDDASRDGPTQRLENSTHGFLLCSV
jgi:hypothetical protein